MCTTDSAGCSVNKIMANNLQKLDLVAVNDPENDNYSSSSSGEEEQRNEHHDDSGYRHFNKCVDNVEPYKNSSKKPADLSQLLHSQIAEKIFIENSKNIDIGHKFFLNETSIQQLESLLEVLTSKKSREKSKDIKTEFPIISRVRWLAQPALEDKQYLNGPAKYVIISHTATEEGFDQSRNTLLIRIAQTFHIESQHWADIAYNFMVGSDGNIYEGRGWNVEGAHTQGYNSSSVGIAFVGCFLKHLPPKSALKKCKDLIAYGVKSGFIREDYELLAHRQCRPFESPGDSLFQEIKTWKNWNPNISVKDPAPHISL